ncbi:MAG: 1-deoxy-D-xylulose-5-phosphate synthase, partial [Candidatus Marinimicrobia bacterium]|nr:1-deoxy-D-xylulose-5-phosphate synthase [Candidatus Neomarinimicrobiota bacterium]
MEDNQKYDLLKNIDTPRDLRKLSPSELPQLSQELRNYIIDTVRQTGGHLAPSLGVIELTIALHYIYNTPEDKLIWDVGHQAYGHKVLTGRREELKTNRQFKGLSGFCKRSESEYDAFGAGHASTSISAAVGFAAARELEDSDYRIVSVIGDGSFTGGLAYEGLNNVCNFKDKPFLVILNDNDMSISPNVGAMSNYFSKIFRSPKYQYYKNRIWDVLGYLPRGTNTFRRLGHKLIRPLKKLLAPTVVFEEFGLRYFGPVDGHNVNELLSTFRNIKDLKYPVLLHVKTTKGKGLAKAEPDPTSYHGISPVKPKEKEKTEEPPSKPRYCDIFGDIAQEVAEANEKVVYVTAAMKEGTGLAKFDNKYPGRLYDVGIAEGHAVTFSGGLAAEGYRPIVCIYSTFLQRAYDHIIHDIALQDFPVIFALDRAGLVGADGPTHHGVFDLSYLNTIPKMVIAAPRDGNELRNLLFTALDQTDNLFAIRYPKDSFVKFDKDANPDTLQIGSWDMVR